MRQMVSFLLLAFVPLTSGAEDKLRQAAEQWRESTLWSLVHEGKKDKPGFLFIQERKGNRFTGVGWFPRGLPIHGSAEAKPRVSLFSGSVDENGTITFLAENAWLQWQREPEEKDSGLLLDDWAYNTRFTGRLSDKYLEGTYEVLYPAGSRDRKVVEKGNFKFKPLLGFVAGNDRAAKVREPSQAAEQWGAPTLWSFVRNGKEREQEQPVLLFVEERNGSRVKGHAWFFPRLPITRLDQVRLSSFHGSVDENGAITALADEAWFQWRSDPKNSGAEVLDDLASNTRLSVRPSGSSLEGTYEILSPPEKGERKVLLKGIFKLKRLE